MSREIGVEEVEVQLTPRDPRDFSTWRPGQVRTPSEHSMSRSALSRRSEEMLNLRYSRYLSPRPVDGLDSSFGLDSPSYSLKGSFPTASRSCSQTYLTTTRHVEHGPGPETYMPGSHFRTQSPRPSIGTSPRNTLEQFINTRACSPAPGAYSPTVRQRVKGGTIATSSRFAYTSRQQRQWYQSGSVDGTTHTPGPSHYSVRHGFRSNFK